MVFYHLPYPARAVKSLKEVIVSLVLQHLPVKVSLHEVWKRSNLVVGSIGHVSKAIMDLKHNIHLAMEGKFPSSNVYGILKWSAMSIAEEFPAEVW